MIKPYYQHDGITIYNADNVDVLCQMEKESIDLVVTSPPYDNLRNYGKSFKWDFYCLASLLSRVLKPGGVIVWIVNDQVVNGSETGTSFRQALHFKEIGLNLHDTMIYAKDGSPYPDNVRYYPSFEYMFVVSKGRPRAVNLISDKVNHCAGEKMSSSTERQKDGSVKYASFMDVEPNRRVRDKSVRTNIWTYSPGYMKSTKDEIAYKHPAIFPEKLARDHIQSWSNEGDTILDPFNGSGTTMKMCREMGRKGIGIELEKEYCEAAVNRLAQGTLF